MKIILASGSPRRCEIMKNAGYEFEVITSSVDETLPYQMSPKDAVMYLAEIKGDAVAKENSAIVISADTVVALGNDILGKPKDEEDAFNMLKSLSGKTHSVYTGVCVQNREKKSVFCEKTDVTFFPLTDDEIREYISFNESYDKAGGYGIQGKGAILVEKIDGDYLNVVGLPMAKLHRALKEYK